MTEEPGSPDAAFIPAPPLVPAAHQGAVPATAPSGPASDATPGPALEPVATRRLVGAAFELLGRSGDELRRASFYIGAITLGTVGPLALASWAIGVVATERPAAELDAILSGPFAGVLSLLGIIAGLGILVAAIESRVMASALLGARMAGQAITPRRALARSRRVFWRSLAATIVAAIPVGIAQGVASSVIDPLFGAAVEISVVTTTAVTAIVGAPFAYVLAGVVLGDVGPLESVRRSIRVFGARKVAAAIVVAFETVAFLLILLGLTAGLDLAIRALDALGLGFDAGPAGLALMTGGIVAAVFAFGTLVFTVIGIAIAPQVVMFVGLTHATIGLDTVLPDGAFHPDGPTRPGARPFRTLTPPMVAGFAMGAVLLAVAIASLTG